MTSIKDFTSQEKANLFLGASIGFGISYFFLDPLHQDRASRIKSVIYDIVGAVIGFVIAYIWINSNHK